MKAIGKFVVGALFVFAVYMIWALPIMWIYNHYIVLWLAITPLTYWTAVGVTIFIMAVQMMFTNPKSVAEVNNWGGDETMEKIAQAIMKPFIVWALAVIGFYFVR